jgi:hypothetical protein
VTCRAATEAYTTRSRRLCPARSETFNLHRSHIRGDGRIFWECDSRHRFGFL